MNDYNTFGILFFIRRDKINNHGESPIFARVTVNGKRTDIAIKRSVDPNKWDPKAGKGIGVKENIRALNHFIETIRSKIYSSQKKLMDNDQFVTAQAIKNDFLGINVQHKTLLEVFDTHNADMKEKIGIDYASGTYERYLTARKHLFEFMKLKLKCEDIFLSQINLIFITDFESYLMVVRGCGNNSTLKYIRNFKKIFNLGRANNWVSHDPFLNFNRSIRPVHRDFLTIEELDLISKKEISNKRIEEVRDIFIFGCYTGFAYAEVSKLTPDHVVTGIDGEKWIYINRTKTGIKENVPLLPKALEILEKYKDHPGCNHQNKLLPVKSNQKTNVYLKEIADICGITKNLTFHIARHSFATSITLTNGVPIETVSAMLGHRNISTTQIYAKVIETKVSEDMLILKNKLVKNGQKEEVKRTK
ncbi:site-specific integrase [Sphingobacteriaceae bacterium AH-315-L07]|nr:site-specific integrase [Sphingobacteriaceae bacterium AH-315-L07]